MKLHSPASALAWEIWHRNRTMLLSASGALLLGALVARTVGANSAWSPSVEAGGYTCIAVIVLLCFGSFHFTEGEKKGGFGRFPLRLFRLPVATAQLVALPMISGAVLVALFYVSAAFLFFRPLGRDLPILWPVLYLVFGLTQFQMILWSLPEHRYAKLFCLSLSATLILMGWMFFLPHIVAGTLSDWGYEGDPETFQRWLLVAMGLAGPAAYLISFFAIRSQRHGSGLRLIPALPRWRARSFGRSAARFRSSAHALYWHEWRQSGLILPAAVAVIIALIAIPTALSQPITVRGTRAVVFGFLLAPLLFALILGRGVAKPNFWRPELSIPLFEAIRPVPSSAWVTAKLQVAGASVFLAWTVTLTSGALWFLHYGAFESFRGEAEVLRFYYSPAERTALAVFTIMTLFLLSWRFLIGGLPTGLSGRKSWFYLQNSLTAFGFISLLTYLLTQGEPDPERISTYYKLWPVLAILPYLLTLAVITKAALAFFAWRKVARYCLAPNRFITLYFVFWTVATLAPVALVIQSCQSTLWLRNSLLLLALLVVPLCGPALGILALSRNRSEA